MVGAIVAPREEGGHDGMSWRSEGSGGIHWMSVLFAVAMGVAPSCLSHSVYLSCHVCNEPSVIRALHTYSTMASALTSLLNPTTQQVQQYMCQVYRMGPRHRTKRLDRSVGPLILSNKWSSTYHLLPTTYPYRSMKLHTRAYQVEQCLHKVTQSFTH